MKKTLAALLMAAVSVAAQLAPTSAPPDKPSAGSETPAKGQPAARSAPAPSYRDLKFPPLRPIQIPKVGTFTLPDGMKVYLLEDHELPVINGVARVRTGNLLDPPDKIGLATMTGMAMRTGGTRTKTGEQLDEQLENIAASVESSIGETSGTVSFSGLKENTDEVLAVFKDVLTAPEFRQDKISLARTQLRSGIARRNDDARGVAEREFAGAVYGKNSPYGWQMEYATVNRIIRGDLQGFYRRYFFPSNITLGVWGDFDAAGMKAKIEKLFSDWNVEQPPVPEFPKVGGKPAPGTYLAVKKDVAQTFFSIGQLGGELKDKDYPALVIMADILGGGFRSRLVERVRTKMGNAYDISADWDANYDHPGLFEISGSTKSLSTVETFKAISEEVDRIRTSEVTEEELKTAKDAALNSLVFAYDTRAKTLGRMLTYEYYGYPPDFIQQYQKALEAVTRADVLRVAKEHLNPADFTTVAVGNPEDFGRPLGTPGNSVSMIDLTIPQEKVEPAKRDAASLEKGKQLLARAQQAVGGTDRLAAVKDYVQSFEFQVDPAAGGLLVKETDRWIAPSYIRQDTVLPSGRISAFCDGRAGWIAAPQGWGALAGAQLKQLQGDLFRLYFRFLLSDRIEGRTVNALDDNSIEIGDTTGQTARLELNAETGLPQRVLYETARPGGPPVPAEETWSDFREIAGVKAPYGVTITQGGRKYAEVKIIDYRVNSGLRLEELQKRP
ncbi:MAG: pitrilysin family protein [Bryobacteraceae bacterium]